jgi:UDP-N-acetylmuramate dehydrogenase
MVHSVADIDSHSAGSFFTNPYVSAEAAAALPPDAPRFVQPDGSVKTSAAWLIDHAGFGKGFSVPGGSGRAALSSKHVLALTNRGGATAAEVLDLADVIRAGVREKYGVQLEPEPVLVSAS